MGSNSAEKMLERMRRTKSGWKPKDFDTLYLGFGFIKMEKTNHTAYKHPKYSDLHDLVARHGKLADGYASTAVKIIDELKARIEAEKEAEKARIEAEKAKKEAEENTNEPNA